MGKILGIDFGETRIGLAISSEDGRFVFPYKTVENGGDEGCFSRIRDDCQKEGVERIVVGLPLDQHGQMGEKARAVKSWGERLSRVVGLEVLYEDERYTTVFANKTKKTAGWSVKETRANIDQTAASMILQTYLDKRHG